MRLFCKNIKFLFCVKDIGDMRKDFQHKICYKKKYQFLNLKHTPSNSICTRLMKRGNFLKIYKVIKIFYYQYVLKKKFYSIPTSSNFLFFFRKYYSFRDIDRVLFWKFIQLESMFAYKVKIFKKKKKQSNKLLFITGIKRTLLCVNILKNLIVLNLKHKKKKYFYKYVFTNFWLYCKR